MITILCDVAVALFDPMRYRLAFSEGVDSLGYKLDDLRDDNGAKKYKSIHLLKNTYGSDDLGVGMGFQPIVGLFKEMPPIDKITDRDYETLRDDSYFLM